jgi:hypothetical protein
VNVGLQSQWQPIFVSLVAIILMLSSKTFAQAEAADATISSDQQCPPGFCLDNRSFQQLCVNPGGTDGCKPTISAAVALISYDNVVITVDPGAYTDNVSINDVRAARPLHLIIQGVSAASTIISGNNAGPVFTIGPNTNVQLSRLTITDGIGGAIQGATEGGGILANGARLKVLSCLISDNQADYGAGIFSNQTDLDIENSSIIDNVGESEGGGVLFESDKGHQLLIVNSTIDGNSAAGGGGIAVYGGFASRPNATIIGSTVSNNVTSGSIEGGAGMDLFAVRLTMLNSTVSGNSATGAKSSGGGMQAGLSYVYLDNVTVADNSAVATAGGINANLFDFIITIIVGKKTTVHVTVPRDQHFVIANTIIADNSAPGLSDCASGVNQPPVESLGYNLVGTCILGGQDETNVYSDPLLGPLQNNGGITDTQALLTGSPALNAGNPAKPDQNGRQGRCLESDQIGTPRPPGSCDIGAWQLPQ